MKPDMRCELLESLGLVGSTLGVLEGAALRAGRADEMAALEMRLALLRARLRAGIAGPELLAGIRLFIEDFEAFFSLCCR